MRQHSPANWIRRNAIDGYPWHVSWPEGDLRTINPRGELPLLERPFVLGVYDCWGLVMSYYRQTYGIELPDYRVDYPWWEDQYPTIYIRITGMNAGSVK
jgi:cell wall-associated NlpC family hydrolase